MNITDNLSQDTIYKQGTSGLSYGRPQQNYSVPSFPSPLNKAPSMPKQSFLPNIPSQRRYNENETPEQEPQSFDLNSANALVDHAFDAAPTGEGALSSSSNSEDREKVKNDLANIANSDNPQEAADKQLNTPFYKSNSFFSSMIGTGLAIMSGKDPSEAYQAGINAGAAQDNKDAIAQSKRSLAAQRDKLAERYDPASIEAAIQSGDPSALREKRMTQAEQQAQRKAELQESRNYEQSIHDRDRGEQLEDRAAAAKAKGDSADWAMNAKGVMYNKRTGETKDSTGALSTKPGSAFPSPEGVDEETANIASKQGYYKDQEQNYHEYDNKKGQYVLVNEKKAAMLKANEPATIQGNISSYDDSLNRLLSYQPMETDKNGNFVVKDISEKVKATSGTLNANTPTLFADTKDAQAEKKSIASNMITAARDKLKGQGAVSDADLKMLGESETILNQEGLSPQTQAKELARIANILKRAKDRESNRLNRKGALSSDASNTPKSTNRGETFNIGN